MEDPSNRFSTQSKKCLVSCSCKFPLRRSALAAHEKFTSFVVRNVELQGKDCLVEVPENFEKNYW